MLKRISISEVPLKNHGIDNIAQTRFGAVLSRAGVGKTRFLVQIALTSLLEDKKSFMSVLTTPWENQSALQRRLHQPGGQYRVCRSPESRSGYG